MSAKERGCECLNVDCYSHLLTDIFNFPVRYCENFERVIDIARMYPNNNVLIRIDGHLTVSCNSIIYDLFDCRQRLVTKYWIIPNKN